MKQTVKQIIYYEVIDQLLRRYSNISEKETSGTAQKILHLAHILDNTRQSDKSVKLKKAKEFCITDSIICADAYPSKISLMRGAHHWATNKVMDRAEYYDSLDKLIPIYSSIQFSNLLAAAEYVSRKLKGGNHDLSKKMAVIRGIGGIFPRCKLLYTLLQSAKSNRDKLKNNPIDAGMLTVLVLVSYIELLSSNGHILRGLEKETSGGSK